MLSQIAVPRGEKQKNMPLVLVRSDILGSLIRQLLQWCDCSVRQEFLVHMLLPVIGREPGAMFPKCQEVFELAMERFLLHAFVIAHALR